METIAKINLDLQRPNFATEVDAMQDDGETRVLEVSLTSGGTSWNVPEGAAPMVVFRRPNYTKGMYDQLADGSPAISVDGNTVTVVLSRQMLAVPGQVRASLQFEDSQLNMLTTFPFKINVQANPYGGAQSVQDVVRLQWLEDELGKWLKKAAESGEFDGPPGKTPVKGEDYFTPAEAQQFGDDVYDRAAQKIDPVLESAGAAAEQAESAAGNANAKAERAEAAAQRADTAADGAKRAATEANKQAGIASEAANGAKHAAGLANAAAEGADQAAQRAETAAQGAGQAAQEATSAAIEAGTAVSDANAAAQAASGAAEKAETAANAANDAVEAIPGQIAGKLDKPAAQPAVGQILKVQKINPDGTFVVGWADDGGGTVSDVQINGATIVQDGVAGIPIAGSNKLGVVALSPDTYGIGISDRNFLYLVGLTPVQMSLRYNGRALTGGGIDTAVRIAMCDGKGKAWTAEEQAAAKDRMGIYKPVMLVADISVAEPIASIVVETDSIGNPLECDALYALFDIAQSSGDTNLHVRINSDEFLRLQTNGIRSSYRSLCYFAMYRVANRNVMEFSSSRMDDNGGAQLISTPQRSIFYKTREKLSKIEMFSTKSNFPIPAGSKIKVYGVRA